MYASIRVLKEHLKDHPELGSRLNLLCKKVREEIDACVYTPHSGALMAFLNLLSQHGVHYETIYEQQNWFNTSRDVDPESEFTNFSLVTNETVLREKEYVRNK